MFETRFEPLSADRPAWGEVAILPWDSETFGFPVGEYKVANTSMPVDRSSLAERGRALGEWAAWRRVELIACTIDGNNVLGRAVLQALRFVYIDSTLSISLAPLQEATFGAVRGVVRLAEAEDQPDLERIAEHAFRHGRYHADARFPPHLADLRYRHWIRKACSNFSVTNRVYVAGDRGAVRAFIQVQTSNQHTADVGIQAVAPEARGGYTALDVMTGAFTDLQRNGLRRIVSRVSAANPPIMNLAVFHGFHFSQPWTIFHWHAPNAPHLLKLDGR